MAFAPSPAMDCALALVGMDQLRLFELVVRGDELFAWVGKHGVL